MNIRYEILRRKDKNRALGQRRKLLEQWTSVYRNYFINYPGKDHRNGTEMYLREMDEIRCLTLEIDLNGSVCSPKCLDLIYSGPQITFFINHLIQSPSY